MSFSNTQLTKNMKSQLFMILRILKNIPFSNTQLTKTCHHNYFYDIINPQK